ncbi:hypothetical protein VX159_08045 [Dechloromonas sp. ZY10]|uniref:hypothetical protein n=1 Tax=Dechloromonas aquae TaxID=2664436 RepID=UPI003528C884
MLKLPKDLALNFAKHWTPIYAEIFQELKAEGGRIQAGKRFAEIRQKFGVSYVLLYDHERKPGIAIMLALLGEDGFKQFNQDSATWSEQEINNFFKEIESQEFQKELLDHLNLTETEAEWAEQKTLFESLPEDQKTASQKTAVFLFSGFFAHFFNTMALMTHGATMTSLIAQAMQGDDEAFGKAVQVDRFLLTHHPDFMARKQRAQDEGDRRFLSALAYRESNPNLKGKIRYPALFMLFGLLESFQWLDSLRHEEILDLCDEIGLDRFQNRIEDVNYLTKRLIEYRKFQKTGGLSMQ